MDLPFLWGAATSSHQVEGQNVHNDWWDWEQKGKVKEPSGLACDHYQRFREDIRLIQSLGHNAHRFSIEWSRLEPRENEWDEQAFQHYIDVLKELRQRGIEPIVTLHHFTNPAWFNAKGGWLSDQAVFYFTRYARKAVEAFGAYIRFWITLNEPMIFLYFGFIEGAWPPGIQSVKSSHRALRHLLHAHVYTYQIIHEHHEKKLGQPVWVSISQHVGCFTPAQKNHPFDHLSVALRNWFASDLFIQAAQTGFLFFPGIFCEFLPLQNTLDYLGVNYYMREFIRFGGFSFVNALGIVDAKENHKNQIGELNFMGWEIYPEGLYQVMKRMKKFNLPIMITENGICALNDEQRVRYIRSHLDALRRATQEGVDIRGYLYWSLLDNFEWAHGYGPRFGIVEIDFKTQERKVRKSAYVLTDLCRKWMAELSV